MGLSHTCHYCKRVFKSLWGLKHHKKDAGGHLCPRTAEYRATQGGEPDFWNVKK